MNIVTNFGGKIYLNKMKMKYMTKENIVAFRCTILQAHRGKTPGDTLLKFSENGIHIMCYGFEGGKCTFMKKECIYAAGWDPLLVPNKEDRESGALFV